MVYIQVCMRAFGCGGVYVCMCVPGCVVCGVCACVGDEGLHHIKSISQMAGRFRKQIPFDFLVIDL